MEVKRTTSICNYISKYKSLSLIITIFSFVILTNLDNSYLWKDEAGTANVAYNTMLKGYPTVYDGKNLLSTSDGNNFNSKLLVSNHEWLQYYICAGAFALFGKTTFSARFPFALFAIASIIIIWLIAKRIFCSTRCADLAGILYAINVQFLLYARQSRYYSLVLFFTATSTLLMLMLFDILKNENTNFFRSKYHLYFLFILSVALLFMSNRLGGIVFAAAIVCYVLITHDKRLFFTIFLLGIGVLPWGIWYFINNMVFNAPGFGGNEIETHVFTKIIMILWKIQVYFFPIISMLVITVIFYLLNYILEKKEKVLFSGDKLFFVVLCISNVIVTAMPKWGIVNHYYLSILVAIPFILLPIIKFVWKSSKACSLIVVLTIIFSNVLSILPYGLLNSIPFENNQVNNLLSDNYSWTTNYGLFSSPDTDANFRITPLSDYKSKLRIESYLYNYLKEVRNGYYSSIQEICDYINARSINTDTILVVGMEYEPIIFYTNLRVVNNLSTEFKPWNDYFSVYPNQEKYDALTQVEDNKIDWIILKKDSPLSLFLNDPNYLVNNKALFEIYTSKTSDIILSTSADLDYHKFETVTDETKFTIWHRKRNK